MRILNGLAIVVALASGAGPVLAQDAGPTPAEKFHLWLYWHTGLISDENVTKTVEMIQRMKKAGYTGVALLDNKLQRPGEQTPQFVENVKKVRQACTDAGLDLVAACLPLGYANDILAANPNLAAAMPVVAAPFVVKDGRIVPADPVRLVNGDFAESAGNEPAG